MLYKIIICIWLVFPVYAFGQNKVSKKEFKQLVGCWQGTLTYLDYTSGKPFTMPANLNVMQKKSKDQLILQHIYPKEPKANAVDTLQLDKGSRIDGNEVISKQRTKGELIIITQRNGVDGNDNKQALIRYTYTVSKKKYVKKKEVQFAGTFNWILRNEYNYTAVECNESNGM